MKHLQTFIKSAMLLGMLFVSVNLNAQEMRFVQTGSIDQYGNRQGPSSYGSKEIKLNFDGNDITESSGMLTLRWRYHHSQGGNLVYYLVAKDYISGRELLNDQSVIVVASDYSVINRIDRNWTLIYEHQERDYGTIAR